MFRMFITYVVPLVLPTLFFMVWAAWARRKIAATHATEEQAQEIVAIKTPWFRLILAGIGLMVVGLLLSVLLGPKNPPKNVYQAPHIVDGKIVPGKYAPK